MSFLEMLDVVNDELTMKGEEPIAFAHDCREGICGTCSLHDQRQAARPAPRRRHLPDLHAQLSSDGDVITVEPFRATALPAHQGPDHRPQRVRQDPAGGRLHQRAHRRAPDANAIPVPKEAADLAMDAAACIGCGACVAACKNASAMLFVAPRSRSSRPAAAGPARARPRVLAMVRHDGRELGFGNCTNQYECSAVCPKLITHDFIARMNRDYLKATCGLCDGIGLAKFLISAD
jgi:succinate dehydrogenase / fumarate reductase iron-sulfur subunit